jgi:hypothetical protein
MNTWPSELKFKFDQSYASAPSVRSTTSANGSIRLRLLEKNRDDIFSVTLGLNGTQFDTFEAFAENNPDKFIGTYYDSDVGQTATMRIVDGMYTYVALSDYYWSVRMQIEVFDRNHTNGEAALAIAEAMGAEFGDLLEISNLLAVVVNENEL